MTSGYANQSLALAAVLTLIAIAITGATLSALGMVGGSTSWKCFGFGGDDWATFSMYVPAPPMGQKWESGVFHGDSFEEGDERERDFWIFTLVDSRTEEERGAITVGARSGTFGYMMAHWEFFDTIEEAETHPFRGDETHLRDLLMRMARSIEGGCREGLSLQREV